ncbi:MAG TPA: D-alanyl-D-alanine carboxypeptidase family protein [Gallionellaceae bacterium]|nr:D-alanyl-D-alanine carboxypeptidase family protein [Gallionellaceae bacterium]
MKLTLTLLISLLLPVVANAKTPAADNSQGATDHMQAQAPKLSARAYLLYDYSSRQILLERNGHERIEPASLTKLMTAYLTFAALKQNKLLLSQKVTPSTYAIRAQRSESRLFLERGKTVSIAELLRGLIVVSANDAARTLAETIAGNEPAFAELMNQEAQRLGMRDTRFVNATGLPDPLHYSSAYDLALLSAAILDDFPEHFPLYSMREFEYNHIKHYNRNRLLWLDPNVDGMKTGHTESAGYGLVATAKRNNHRLMSVVLGTTSEYLRNSESQRLLNYGYQDFDIFYLYQKNQTISNIRLWKGTENTVKAGIRDGLTLTLPKGQRPLLKATIETQQPLLAPIGDGQQLGVLKLTLDGKPYMEFPLVALEPVPLVNIFSRGIDSIRMIFSQ